MSFVKIFGAVFVKVLSRASPSIQRLCSDEQMDICYLAVRISPMRSTAVHPIVPISGYRHGPPVREPSPLHLSPEDKLDALRKLDEFLFWHSLDDVRFCTECQRSITGWQVQVIESNGTRGRLHLQCPTEGCTSLPSQWVDGDPIRAAALRSDAGSFDLRQSTHNDKIAISHHGQARTGRLLQVGRNKPSFRAVLSRLAIIRSIATGLHGFHPIP